MVKNDDIRTPDFQFGAENNNHGMKTTMREHMERRQSYDIVATDGSRFCSCTRDGYTFILQGKNSTITLEHLLEQVCNPAVARKRKYEAMQKKTEANRRRKG